MRISRAIVLLFGGSSYDSVDVEDDAGGGRWRTEFTATVTLNCLTSFCRQLDDIESQILNDLLGN